MSDSKKIDEIKALWRNLGPREHLSANREIAIPRPEGRSRRRALPDLNYRAIVRSSK